MRTVAGWLALLLTAVLWAGTPSHAYFLDANRNFDVRLRAYSQLGIMTDSSETDWPGNPQSTCIVDGKPSSKCRYHAGDLAQHRNFYNPEFDAKLIDYMRWMNDAPGLSLIAPDDFKFRFAWWGFYDGLYDYLDGPWNFNRRNLKARESESDNPRKESFSFSDHGLNAREIYAHQNRINELYVDYTKGRFFTRVGRQAISWGESDDIVFLDRINLFDLTQGAPGFFQDLDEARIPFWALRTTYKLIDRWQSLSNVFADAYVVPGVIDTTVPILMVGGVSPFNADTADPQVSTPAAQRDQLHVVTVTRLPKQEWSNTRWGARLTGVIARNYTVQGWFYRTFPEQPTPLLTGGPGAIELGATPNSAVRPTFIDDRGYRTPVCLDNTTNQPIKKGNFTLTGTSVGHTPAGRRCSFAEPIVTVLDRHLESVIGLAATWFSQPLNGIVRTEAEYFRQEQAFIPGDNLNPLTQVPASIAGVNLLKGGQQVKNHIPLTDYVRWVIGYDRFFFVRPLNPNNSFTLSAAIHGETNVFERRERDFRNSNQKPGKPATELGKDPRCTKTAVMLGACQVAPPKNFEDAKAFDSDYLTLALQTDYMHGLLEPRIVMLIWASGIYAFSPTVTYRFNDNLLFSATYLAIESSRRALLGTFRGHDMVQLRVTFQLN
jgi:hypothetical protein